MSCWVVPSVAAELWGMTVGQVLEQVRLGSVPTKTELGFTLVDVAPNSPCLPGGMREPAGPAKTYVKVGEQQAPQPQEEAYDWQRARRQTQTLRRPPVRVPALAAA